MLTIVTSRSVTLDGNTQEFEDIDNEVHVIST